MKEIFHLIKQCLICWKHGFKTKTGWELFMLEQALEENAAQPIGQMNPCCKETRQETIDMTQRLVDAQSDLPQSGLAKEILNRLKNERDKQENS